MIDVVIPCRPSDIPTLTLTTLVTEGVSMRFIVQVDHQLRGQSWARNRGIESVRAPYMLLSDYDIHWLPGTVKAMVDLLDAASYQDVGYVYCPFQWVDTSGVPVLTLGRESWSLERLRRGPYYSPMTLWRVSAWKRAHLCFDEELRRLEDWDLFLTAAERGIKGACCPLPQEIGFQTTVKPGISWETPTEFAAAEAAVRRKHPC